MPFISIGWVSKVSVFSLSRIWTVSLENLNFETRLHLKSRGEVGAGAWEPGEGNLHHTSGPSLPHNLYHTPPTHSYSRGGKELTLSSFLSFYLIHPVLLGTHSLTNLSNKWLTMLAVSKIATRKQQQLLTLLLDLAMPELSFLFFILSLGTKEGREWAGCSLHHSAPFSASFCAFRELTLTRYQTRLPGPPASGWIWPKQSTGRSTEGKRTERLGYLFLLHPVSLKSWSAFNFQSGDLFLQTPVRNDSPSMIQGPLVFPRPFQEVRDIKIIFIIMLTYICLFQTHSLLRVQGSLSMPTWHDITRDWMQKQKWTSSYLPRCQTLGKLQKCKIIPPLSIKFFSEKLDYFYKVMLTYNGYIIIFKLSSLLSFRLFPARTFPATVETLTNRKMDQGCRDVLTEGERQMTTNL